MQNLEIVKFNNGDFELDVSVSPSEDTVWLTKEQIALLFGRDRTVITKHIQNVYKENELEENQHVQKKHKFKSRVAERLLEKKSFIISILLFLLDIESTLKMVLYSANGRIAF